MLVISVRRRRRLDDGVEVTLKCLTKRELPEPFGRQYLQHLHGWRSGPVRVRLVHGLSTPYVSLGIPMRRLTEGEHLGSQLGPRAAPPLVMSTSWRPADGDPGDGVGLREQRCQLGGVSRAATSRASTPDVGGWAA